MSRPGRGRWGGGNAVRSAPVTRNFPAQFPKTHTVAHGPSAAPHYRWGNGEGVISRQQGLYRQPEAGVRAAQMAGGRQNQRSVAARGEMRAVTGREALRHATRRKCVARTRRESPVSI